LNRAEQKLRIALRVFSGGRLIGAVLSLELVSMTPGENG
tara:strand:+ start:4249 stop:4365 length:117 start_codon:yes stop_codon:yes gene_type:complete